MSFTHEIQLQYIYISCFNISTERYIPGREILIYVWKAEVSENIKHYTRRYIGKSIQTGRLIWDLHKIYTNVGKGSTDYNKVQAMEIIIQRNIVKGYGSYFGKKGKDNHAFIRY